MSVHDDLATLRETVWEIAGCGDIRFSPTISSAEAEHEAALARVEAELSRLGALYSCGYATGRGQNCGKCQQCLLVHEHFLKEAYEQQKAELSRLREQRDYDVWNERILRRAAEARRERLEQLGSERLARKHVSRGVVGFSYRPTPPSGPAPKDGSSGRADSQEDKT